MNKIFKVIWSRVKGCYIVVSELAHNHDVGTLRTRTVKQAISLGTMMAVFASLGLITAYADDNTADNQHYLSIQSNTNDNTPNSNYNNDGAKGPGSIAIGKKAKVQSTGKDAIAIGTDANAINEGDVALGSGCCTRKWIHY